MINKLALIAIANLNSSPVLAETAYSQVMVNIDLVGDDGLTQKLSDAVQTAVKKESRYKLVQRDGAGVFTVTSESNVDWTELGHRTVIIYRVSIRHAGHQTDPVIGACFESAISKCSSEILRLVKIEASSVTY